MDGVAMGSLLEPLFADIVMSKLENNHPHSPIRHCTESKRYVDDILCAIEEHADINHTLHNFNHVHSNGHFTLEETGNS